MRKQDLLNSICPKLEKIADYITQGNPHSIPHDCICAENKQSDSAIIEYRIVTFILEAIEEKLLR